MVNRLPEYAICLGMECGFEAEYLSESEAVLLRSLHESRKVDWIVGRVAAKRAVRAYLLGRYAIDVPFSAIGIISRPLRKPTVVIRGRSGGDPSFWQRAGVEMDLSLSHSDGVAVAAASFIAETGLIGVDLERSRAFSRDFLEEFLTPVELLMLDGYPESDRGLVSTILWCAKESYLKAIGSGLCRHPKTVDVTLELDRKSGMIGELSSGPPEAEFFWELLPNGCVFVILTLPI